MNLKLNHLHFATPNLAATRLFYETYFGFREHYRLKNTLVLTNDQHFLLALDDADPAANIAPPPFHFGFCVESAETVRGLFDRMRAAGVTFSQEFKTLSPNAVSFYCLDPHGNQVEVGWYRNL